MIQKIRCKTGSLIGQSETDLGKIYCQRKQKLGEKENNLEKHRKNKKEETRQQEGVVRGKKTLNYDKIVYELRSNNCQTI